MGCFVALLALLSPRLALFGVWIFSDLLSRAFDSWIVPVLGFFLLPWTTLAYAVMWDSSREVSGARVVPRDPGLPVRPRLVRPGPPRSASGRLTVRLILVVAALLAALALVSCGDDDDDNGGGEPSPAATTGGAACIESWNEEASTDVKGYTVAGVSERPVKAGTYRGNEFSASTDSDSVTVRPGDCVVAQVTPTETEYVFVKSRPSSGGPVRWYSLEEEGTPLEEPYAQLEDTADAKLVGYGPDGKLEPQGG